MRNESRIAPCEMFQRPRRRHCRQASNWALVVVVTQSRRRHDEMRCDVLHSRLDAAECAHARRLEMPTLVDADQIETTRRRRRCGRAPIESRRMEETLCAHDCSDCCSDMTSQVYSKLKSHVESANREPTNQKSDSPLHRTSEAAQTSDLRQ